MGALVEQQGCTVTLPIPTRPFLAAFGVALPLAVVSLWVWWGYTLATSQPADSGDTGDTASPQNCSSPCEVA